MARLKYVPVAALVIAAQTLWGSAVSAQEIASQLSPMAAESFPVGTSGAVCEAQGANLRDARRSVFDRKWQIVCADAEAPIGTALALRGDDAPARALGLLGEPLACEAPTDAKLDGGIGAQALSCRGAKSGLQRVSYSYRAGGVYYLVSGLSGYDSALRLALRTMVADRIIPGEVAAATTGAASGVGEAAAAAADTAVALGQGYRRNNAGAYAEAAQMFESVAGDMQGGAQDVAEQERQLHDMRANEALQLSNMGEFDQAARIFAETRELAANDPVQTRLQRNYEAIDSINRGDLPGALDILARPVPSLAGELAAAGGSVEIDPAMAGALNTGDSRQGSAIFGREVHLTVPERAAIIDAQADEIRGTVLRLEGKLADARAALGRANASAIAVREGRVVSIIRLRAQILSEQAMVDEAAGRDGDAETGLRAALAMIETQYPSSASLNAARARLAGFMARHGHAEEARAIFRTVVTSVVGEHGALVGMTNLMQPYFDLLTQGGGDDPARIAELFLASQLVERSGAAEAMAQLSRQLEGGNGPAAEQFRQLLDTSRDVERTRIMIAQANAAKAAGGQAPQLADLTARENRLITLQLKLINALSAFPQYRSVARDYATLDEMRALLKPGEAYLKLVLLGDQPYAVYASPTAARGWRIAMSADDLASAVATLRDSISVTINGVRSTYPFDVDTAGKLYQQLLWPIAGELPGVRHLIFEPDGAMFKLPVNLLITDPATIAAYHRRVDNQGGDEYDFRGIAWLGRGRAVSTALSAASFRDARRAPPSAASLSYLGMGQNQPLGPVTMLPSERGAPGETESTGCDWPVALWNQPVSSAELKEAAALFGPARSSLMTKAAFTDTAIINRGDLANFRIIHFATHGLVTAPRAGCPAQPALVTSFGGEGSTGLLKFDEIFNLHLDADLIILSACDTAGQATREATLEAGVRTGGGQALDGLVRAFIAAGGREVIASHWPAPDDYGATHRLFGRFLRSAGEPIGEALRKAQAALMDDPETSHPFYWAGFAIIGDGAKPLGGR